MVGRIVPHSESCLGVMQRTLETMAGVQRHQGDRAWNLQRRSSLVKRPSSPSYWLDFLRRGILWHISHGWGDPCAHRGLLVRALGIEQLRQRLDRMATRDSMEFHSAHAKDVVSFQSCTERANLGTSSNVCRKKNSTASYGTIFTTDMSC